ncbi:MAG: Tetratricopeptide repeat protein, partial [Bacteroidetes bacterium]|nr:Tetratricopeptide repeat protein [Bacteroidota bacterium]
MINHRYNVLRKLGEGGSGEVFLVEDTLKQQQQLAMKILHQADQSDGSADEEFRNEVSMLVTLHHPNLVRVFDFGLVRHADSNLLQGRRFFTMECLEGKDALQWYRSLRGDQERVAHLQHILLQTLGVLSYIHCQGILHFDIKPENLLLISVGGENGLPLVKLTDFGFSTKQDSSIDLPLRGTIEYTAPELLKHEPFDHRIDLYSLGATLFHLIEDRCPFEGRDPVELIKRVLTAEPDFKRSFIEPYSQFASLMENLLERNPSQRFPSAREAIRVLLPENERANIFSFEIGAKPQFVGREKEKEQIGGAIVLLGQGEKNEGDVAITIVGPEGIGKTALLAEVVRLARTRDIPVLEVGTTHRDVPFGAIRSLLPLIRAELLSRSGKGQHLVEKHRDVIDGGLGENSMTLQGEWLKEKEKVIEAQARFIHQCSLLFPFMLVVDNADQLDVESAAVLRVASRGAKPGRLLLLASERGDGIFLSSVRRIRLGELDARQVSAMGASIFSQTTLGEILGSRLHQLYGGSPLVLVEALHSVGTLLPVDLPTETSAIHGVVESVIGRLPRDIDQFLFNRYKSLDRGRQLTLDILSHFENPVLLEVLQALLPFHRQRTSEYLSSLEAEGLVLFHEDGRRCSMRHEKLKGNVYAALTQNQHDVHFFVASTMESLPLAWSFSDLQEIAYQYIEGGRLVDGIRWLEKAGDEGVRIASYRRAKELYNQAVLRVVESDTERLNRLRMKLAQAMLDSGAYREAIDQANHLLNGNSLGESDEIVLHKVTGLAHSRLGEFEDSKKHLGKAIERSTGEKEKIELQQEMVGIDIALGNYVEAEQASLAQLDRARRLGDQRIAASI